MQEDFTNFVYDVPKPMAKRDSSGDPTYRNVACMGYIFAAMFLAMVVATQVHPPRSPELGRMALVMCSCLAAICFMASCGYMYTAIMDARSRIPHAEWRVDYDTAKEAWQQRKQAFVDAKSEAFRQLVFPLVHDEEVRALAGEGNATVVKRQLVVFQQDDKPRGLTLNPGRITRSVGIDGIKGIRFPHATFFWTGFGDADVNFEYGAKEGVEILV